MEEAVERREEREPVADAFHGLLALGLQVLAAVLGDEAANERGEHFQLRDGLGVVRRVSTNLA